jgi:hypothetical protein
VFTAAVNVYKLRAQVDAAVVLTVTLVLLFQRRTVSGLTVGAVEG